jgi:hypothetical protein
VVAGSLQAQWQAALAVTQGDTGETKNPPLQAEFDSTIFIFNLFKKISSGHSSFRIGGRVKGQSHGPCEIVVHCLHANNLTRTPKIMN